MWGEKITIHVIRRNVQTIYHLSWSENFYIRSQFVDESIITISLDKHKVIKIKSDSQNILWLDTCVLTSIYLTNMTLNILFILFFFFSNCVNLFSLALESWDDLMQYILYIHFILVSTTNSRIASIVTRMRYMCFEFPQLNGRWKRLCDFIWCHYEAEHKWLHTYSMVSLIKTIPSIVQRFATISSKNNIWQRLQWFNAIKMSI